MLMLICAIVPAVMWLGLLLVPWRPWSTREHLEAGPSSNIRLDDITVLIPARNEADVIGTALRGLQAQGAGLQVIVIDDQSTDATASVVDAFPNLRVIPG